MIFFSIRGLHTDFTYKFAIKMVFGLDSAVSIFPFFFNIFYINTFSIKGLFTPIDELKMKCFNFC